MKNKGFTLVELLVAISLLALLTVIAIPTLRAFQTSNDKKQYESYAKSVTSSAKLYNDAYSDDLFGNLDSGCQKVSLTEMINKKMAKDIALKDITCNKIDSDSYALVWKFKDEYSYNSIVHCFNSNDVSQYNSGEEEAEKCLSTTKKPELSVTVNQNESKNSKKKSVNIILSDDFGFTANQEIEYLWSTTKNDTGTGLGSYTNYKYNNSYIKRVDKTVTLTSNSITIPGTTTGNYYLYIRPIKVLNIVNENLTGVKRFGPFRFDHTPPSCPTVKAVDSSGKNINKNTQAHIDHFTIDYSADDLQNYEIKVSYDNGAHYSNAVTKSSSINTYTPTGDGQIKIMTRAKDLANNQSDWCTSDMFINDNTPPNAPTVTGYKKGSVTDISSKGNLGTHPTDTWLKGWVFTQATGSTDTYSSVTYHYSAEGTTTNTNDTVSSHRNVNAEGTSTVRFWACDSVNNCSGKVTYKVKLDRTAPSCGTAEGASTTWTNSNRTIKQACTETSGSGCEKNSYNNEFTTTTKVGAISIKDNVGNTTTCQPNVYVDKTAPTCGTASGASTTWTKNNRTIKQACSDSDSGCQKTSYDTIYSSTKKTDTVTISDNAGNTNKCDYDVYVDKTAPTCGAATGASTTWTYKARTIKQACSDSDSGCEKDSYEKEYKEYKATDSITIKDKVGNTKSCDYNVYVDPNTMCGKKEFPENDDFIYMRVEPDWGKIYGQWCGQGDDDSEVTMKYGTCSSAIYYVAKGQNHHPEIEFSDNKKWKVQIICDTVKELNVPSGVKIITSRSKDKKITCYRSKDDDGVNSKGYLHKFIKVKVLVYDKSEDEWNPNLRKLSDMSKVDSKKDFFHRDNIEWIKNEETGDLYAYLYMASNFFSIEC